MIQLHAWETFVDRKLLESVGLVAWPLIEIPDRNLALLGLTGPDLPTYRKDFN